MSSDKQTIAARRPDAVSGVSVDEQLDARSEERLARLRTVALPVAQRKAGKRQPRGVAGTAARILAGCVLYSLPLVALCVGVVAFVYAVWVVADVARAAGSLDFSRLEDAFSQIDLAARAMMASVVYALLVLALYLLAAALRASETWLPLLVTLILAAPVALVFTLGADLAFSLAPPDAFPPWGRDAIEALILAHATCLAVLLRMRRPVTQALNNLAFTRRHDAGILYTGALPRLHVIRFSTGPHPAVSAPPPHLLDAQTAEVLGNLPAQPEEAAPPQSEPSQERMGAANAQSDDGATDTPNPEQPAVREESTLL
jgi:hypothetical protein